MNNKFPYQLIDLVHTLSEGTPSCSDILKRQYGLIMALTDSTIRDIFVLRMQRHPLFKNEPQNIKIDKTE